jgi:arylsulfatase A-like enzyme
MHDRDCRNAQLTPWPKDLPEWDVGRVIQAVEDLGEFDNTLIIYIGYIGGDNGASAEGMLNGAPNEFTTFNGVAVQVKDQFLWYPFWGSERTYPHFAAGWAWALIFARRGGISAFPPLLRWYRRPRSRG